MKKKLIIVLVVALVGAGGAYKTVLAKPGKAEPKPKVEGEIYVLPKEFLVNLADGRFAKLQVALVAPRGLRLRAAGGDRPGLDRDAQPPVRRARRPACQRQADRARRGRRDRRGVRPASAPAPHA